MSLQTSWNCREFGVPMVGETMKNKLIVVLALTCLCALNPQLSTVRAQTIFGNALAFNGASQYVSVPGFGSIAPTNEVTIEFWAYINQAASQAAFMLNPIPVTNRFMV